jgi:chloramphenicol 3-O phosphotransferase
MRGYAIEGVAIRACFAHAACPLEHPTGTSEQACGRKCMGQRALPGQIVILNGAPRSGKSSIATAIQHTFAGVWMNVGVDRFKPMTSERYQPGIGLRPGGERPDLEPLIMLLYRAMYQAIAHHSRLGLNVVVDVGHDDADSVPRGILPKCARQLHGLPVLFVGVHCPLEVIMERRRATWLTDNTPDGSIPPAVLFWQQAVHLPGIYDVEVDTSVLSAEECAALIQQRLTDGRPPSAFPHLATITMRRKHAAR